MYESEKVILKRFWSVRLFNTFLKDFCAQPIHCHFRSIFNKNLLQAVNPIETRLVKSWLDKMAVNVTPLAL